ncbi:MAG: IS1096 element passenger TnpR family protein [Bacillota bacterium]
MVRGWFTVRVELESGGGLQLKRRPGRIMLVGPQHTFKDLAEAIDRAFARWDISHLHEFEFPDGRCYGLPDDEYGLPIIDYARVKAGSVVRKREPFIYVFDLGDNWKHNCRVIDSNLDPGDDGGTVPESPVPIWGWGWIPDQYGRRWDGDTGEDDPEENDPEENDPEENDPEENDLYGW